MPELKLLGERQEVLIGMVVTTRDMQKEAPKKYQEKVFEEFMELEEQRAKEALRECCKDWEDRERQRIGMTLETICPLSLARPQWHVTWKK